MARIDLGVVFALDAVVVWREALKTHSARSMAVFGSSAGGSLTLEMVLQLKQLGLPLPAAIAPGSPMSDLTGVGDSFTTNAMVDNVSTRRPRCNRLSATSRSSSTDI